ncbi:MAG: S9 family peptidase [Acidimicrobiales bacterium]
MSGEHPADGGERPAPVRTEPFGWWPSPWPAARVAAGKISRSGLLADGESVYWSESRPADGGRQVVVRSDPGAPPVDVSPPGVGVRSRVHEYGGGAATMWQGSLFYVDQGDQRWHRFPLGGGSAPRALLDDRTVEEWSVRYADGRVTPSGRWLTSVEERVGAGGTEHCLVAVATDGSRRIETLVDTGAFVASPRPSPDGRWLAWVTWCHPSMPWDSSEVWVARLAEGAGSVGMAGGRRVAGGNGCSVGQPRWLRDGSLLFADDRSGWWLPYRLPAGNLEVEPARSDALVEMEAEFHGPDWVLGQSTLAELSDGSIVGRMRRDGRDQVVHLRPTGPIDGAGAAPWAMTILDQPCLSISGLVATPTDRVVVLGSTACEAHGVFELRGDRGQPRRCSAPPEVAVAEDEVSLAAPFVAETRSGPVPGLFFAPTSRVVRGPEGARPPAVVFCHGGPTGSAEGGFDPVVQFFTSRGLAVAAVDYRGSTGYGRAYRQRLEGRWGEADVDDCVAYAVALDEAGWVDGRRMAIRGTSAGGLTALASLVRSDRFAGAASWYGVTDLESLVAETHDFESRYVDSLVGPWPEAAETYRARSPLHHAEQISGQVLLLQGADDPIVPAGQSVRFAESLEARGVLCRLTVFPGESHGFRRASTIEACLVAELGFYRDLFARPRRGADAPGVAGDQNAGDQDLGAAVPISPPPPGPPPPDPPGTSA